MLPRWLITFRALALMSAFAAAFVPIATYITDDKRDWLWIHIGVNIAAYIAVALTTIYTTVSLTQQDHNKYRVPAYWSNNVVMRTWWLGVSRTWRWHVAAAVGRLGLALALAQHLQIVALTGPEAYRASQFQGVFSPFYYISYNSFKGNEYLNEMRPIDWQPALIGLFLLFAFAILETSFMAAITVAFSKLKREAVLILTIGLRIGLILGIALCMSQLYTLIANPNSKETPATLYRWYAENKLLLRQWHQIAFTWLDSGTMLSAWIIRPVFWLYYGSDVSVLNAFIAYSTYILAIIATLQLAHYLHWRREQGMTAHAPADASTA